MKKDVLIIGLGNPLMGDDGVGYHAVQRLADDPRRPPNVEVLWGGTDLLRLAPQMEGRRQVILIDAIFDPSDSGTLQIYRDDFSALVDQQKHVHHLSVVQAIELLKTLSPALKNTSFILLLAGIGELQAGEELTPRTQNLLLDIIELIRKEVHV